MTSPVGREPRTRRSAPALLGALILAAGCGGVPPLSPTASRGAPAPVPSPGEFLPPTSPLPEAGPILTLIIAGDLDAAGRAIEPGTTFSRTSPQVTAIAQIGSLDAPTGELVVSWTVQGPDGDSALFEHRIPVKTGDIAFSTGLSPGRLAVGVYRVRATLNRSVMTADWTVADAAPESARQAPIDPATRIVLAKAVDRGTATTTASEASDPAPGPSEPAAGPPVSGDSGTAAPPGSDSRGGGRAGCSLAITPLGAGTTVYVDATNCAGDASVVAAGPPGGALTVVGQFEGDTFRPYAVNPCDVGGSDLPETKLAYAARVVRGKASGLWATATVDIPADDSPPSVFVETHPEADTLAFRGDPISLRIRAQDGSASGFGQTGIAEIRVTDSAVRTLSHQRYSGPTACDKGRLEKELTVETAIPADARDVYTAFVWVKDFAGNSQRIALGWRTKATWRGLMVGKASAEVSNEGFTNSCRAVWHMLVELDPISERGPVTGTGIANLLSGPTCTYGTFPEVAIRTQVTGTFDGRRFRLQFPAIEWGGYDVAFHVLFYPNLRTLDLPVRGAFATTDFVFTQSGPEELAGGGATATLDGHLALLCDCEAQPAGSP